MKRPQCACITQFGGSEINLRSDGKKLKLECKGHLERRTGHRSYSPIRLELTRDLAKKRIPQCCTPHALKVENIKQTGWLIDWRICALVSAFCGDDFCNANMSATQLKQRNHRITDGFFVICRDYRLTSAYDAERASHHP